MSTASCRSFAHSYLAGSKACRKTWATDYRIIFQPRNVEARSHLPSGKPAARRGGDGTLVYSKTLVTNAGHIRQPNQTQQAFGDARFWMFGKNCWADNGQLTRRFFPSPIWRLIRKSSLYARSSQGITTVHSLFAHSCYYDLCSRFPLSLYQSVRLWVQWAMTAGSVSNPT